MRQAVGPRKVRQLRERTGLPVISARVRGGTDHRIDLFLEGNRTAYLFRDGSIDMDPFGSKRATHHEGE